LGGDHWVMSIMDGTYTYEIIITIQLSEFNDNYYNINIIISFLPNWFCADIYFNKKKLVEKIKIWFDFKYNFLTCPDHCFLGRSR